MQSIVNVKDSYFLYILWFYNYKSVILHQYG